MSFPTEARFSDSSIRFDVYIITNRPVALGYLNGNLSIPEITRIMDKFGGPSSPDLRLHYLFEGSIAIIKYGMLWKVQFELFSLWSNISTTCFTKSVPLTTFANIVKFDPSSGNNLVGTLVLQTTNFHYLRWKDFKRSKSYSNAYDTAHIESDNGRWPELLPAVFYRVLVAKKMLTRSHLVIAVVIERHNVTLHLFWYVSISKNQNNSK